MGTTMIWVHCPRRESSHLGPEPPDLTPAACLTPSKTFTYLVELPSHSVQKALTVLLPGMGPGGRRMACEGCGKEPRPIARLHPSERRLR